MTSANHTSNNHTPANPETKQSNGSKDFLEFLEGKDSSFNAGNTKEAAKTSPPKPTAEDFRNASLQPMVAATTAHALHKDKLDETCWVNKSLQKETPSDRPKVNNQIEIG